MMSAGMIPTIVSITEVETPSPLAMVAAAASLDTASLRTVLPMGKICHVAIPMRMAIMEVTK